MRSRLSRLGGLSLFLAAIAGCASQPITSIPRPASDNQGEVIVYRESSFIAGMVSLTVGVGNDAIASVDNTEYVRILLPPGEHEIFVRARSADPTRLRITVSKNGRVCLRTSASSSALAKAIVPITLIATGYHFYLDELPCPNDADLQQYKAIPVVYAQNQDRAWHFRGDVPSS